jgi:hypothetical protein
MSDSNVKKATRAAGPETAPPAGTNGEPDYRPKKMSSQEQSRFLWKLAGMVGIVILLLWLIDRFSV